MFLDVDLRLRLRSRDTSRDLLVLSCIAIFVPELFARLTTEPFAEKPIDLASTSLCTKPVRGEWSHVWGCVIQFNLSWLRNCRTVTVEKLQKSPNQLSYAMLQHSACTKVNKIKISQFAKIQKMLNLQK